MDEYGRPDSYEELVVRYMAMIRRICAQQVARYGGGQEDVEDLSQQVMLRAMEWDLLSKYQPRKLHKTRDGFKTARFPTFLRAFVSRFTWDLRDRRHRQGRELLTDFEANEWETMSSYRIDDDVETTVFLRSELDEAWVYLATVRLSDAVTAADVFGVMVESAILEGKASATPIAARFAVSRSVATKWRREVLDRLRLLGRVPEFETY